ncbi:MAG: ribonuclease H [Dehalococcoidales bacterium]|jgi:ribonuclease HI|nr:ribonuclease H [Dehalococcoidales bacterium]MDP6222125.1 ribonuclease HI family protein [Dehalococcoidales bacterium]MDP7110279.1 ribonuclease HI family protein [Dehalococcoidales bacterium]MDP7310347.1 ribonuclease HI family protein [Dehalococcoidales bacterium]MDP7409963.1 ribonuclease HI family protein [Dehalococcoidales bacterium]|tara:strand:- start:1605 stop:2018 length:414 start_codon:yes stop_codon:yes gene_type:complete
MKVIIKTDGASRGNPGPSGIGAVIRNEMGKVIASISQPIGLATNNQAEYRAVIAALEKVMKLGVNQVDLRTDSELIVRQVSGRYRVKEVSLKPLCLRVKQLQRQFQSCVITHVAGVENDEAHNLANRALSKPGGTVL